MNVLRFTVRLRPHELGIFFNEDTSFVEGIDFLPDHLKLCYPADIPRNSIEDIQLHEFISSKECLSLYNPNVLNKELSRCGSVDTMLVCHEVPACLSNKGYHDVLPISEKTFVVVRKVENQAEFHIVTLSSTETGDVRLAFFYSCDFYEMRYTVSNSLLFINQSVFHFRPFGDETWDFGHLNFQNKYDAVIPVRNCKTSYCGFKYETCNGGKYMLSMMEIGTIYDGKISLRNIVDECPILHKIIFDDPPLNLKCVSLSDAGEEGNSFWFIYKNYVLLIKNNDVSYISARFPMPLSFVVLNAPFSMSIPIASPICDGDVVRIQELKMIGYRKQCLLWYKLGWKEKFLSNCVNGCFCDFTDNGNQIIFDFYNNHIYLIDDQTYCFEMSGSRPVVPHYDIEERSKTLYIQSIDGVLFSIPNFQRHALNNVIPASQSPLLSYCCKAGKEKGHLIVMKESTELQHHVFDFDIISPILNVFSKQLTFYDSNKLYILTEDDEIIEHIVENFSCFVNGHSYIQKSGEIMQYTPNGICTAHNISLYLPDSNVATSIKPIAKDTVEVAFINSTTFVTCILDVCDHMVDVIDRESVDLNTFFNEAVFSHLETPNEI
ncbi:hypothetical protein PCE1_001506 [Barthelona sp. PCE]